MPDDECWRADPRGGVAGCHSAVLDILCAVASVLALLRGDKNLLKGLYMGWGARAMMGLFFSFQYGFSSGISAIEALNWL